MQRIISLSRRTFVSVLVSSIAALSLSTSMAHAAPAAMPHVILKTNMGDIELELDDVKAPETVKNFLAYVKSGHYSDTIFHRVISNFMIQGGGFDTKMKEKPAPNKVENEAKNGLKNVKYSIAMARTSDPQSASAQFFINTKDNNFLDYPGQDGFGYAVFGKVVKGSNVVDKINTVKTGVNDVPTMQVIIKSATLVK